MRKLKIRGQEWTETDTHLVIRLHQPFWSAAKMFGWDIKCEGLGVSFEAVDKCATLSKRIKVIVSKYGSYEITPSLARKYGEVFVTRDMKKLYVIPRIKFTRLSEGKKKEVKKEIPQEEPTPKQETLL